MTETPARLVACVGCGGHVPDVDGPTHEYLVASPGCWQSYGQWMAEVAWSGQVSGIVLAHHVDCYAVQHPGGAEHDRRQRQSIAVHLIALCRFVEHGEQPQQAARRRVRTGETVLAALALEDWPLLRPPERLGATTFADVVAADVGADLEGVFARWADDCWDAWGDHHATVRQWADVMARAG